MKKCATCKNWLGDKDFAIKRISESHPWVGSGECLLQPTWIDLNATRCARDDDNNPIISVGIMANFGCILHEHD